MLLDFLFPKYCVGCKKFGSYFCQKCLSQLNKVENLICPGCEKGAILGVTHSWCKKRTGLDGLISIFYYRFPIREAIKAFKYSFVSDLNNTLVSYLANEIKEEKFKAATLSWVPLFRVRENWRGFNQSEKLARTLAERLGLVYGDFLERSRDTQPQSLLKGKERVENVKNSFIIKDSPKGQKILIIDDVWTTGATLRECAITLKKAGAEEVWGLTLAR